MGSQEMDKQSGVELWEVTLGFSCMTEGRAGVGGRGENCQSLSCTGRPDSQWVRIWIRASIHSKNEGLPHIFRLAPHPWSSVCHER